MSDRRRGLPGPPPSVASAAVIAFISGGLGVLSGLLNILLGSGAATIATGVIVLVAGGLEVWAGVALRRLRYWARSAVLALAALGIAISIVEIVRSGYGNVLGIAFGGALIYLLTRREAVAAFPKRPERPDRPD